MKYHFILLALLVLFFSCQNATQNHSIPDQPTKAETIPPVTDEMMDTAIIYEANIRQYSPEGTFEAFSRDIPVLKELGVKIIWIMPIHPVSELKRKATGGIFASDIKDEAERNKALGSYYAVADYKGVNPEFGDLKDFKRLVQTAHENGMYVIIDWVPNHTGWDHRWVSEHPEWYTQNEAGEIIDPIDPVTGQSWGWTDVADLNYDNMEMRTEMISDMKYWAKEADIDGFRVDVAHSVPVDFFKDAIRELEKVKPLFMLAEAEKPELFRVGYDMHYAWEGHHLLNGIARGEQDANDFRAYMKKQTSVLQKGDFSMNFVTNHDENSWAGTLGERMPESKELFTALTYVMPGMPLIYSGQEYDLDHRLKFFEKDQIPKEKGAYFDLLAKLGKLKQSNPALNGGKNPADFRHIDMGEKVIAFARTKGASRVTFFGNVSSLEQPLTLSGEFQDYITGETLKANDNAPFWLEPWQFLILVH